MVGHQVARGPRRGPAAACRALALLLLTAGCGELHFVPSPYTPQQVELVYSAQEHLTVVRWRVSASAPVSETRFEMLAADGYHPIDFSKSAYPGGVVQCGDKRGACAQYVVRGKYEVDRTARPIRAVHDVYGTFPGVPASTRSVSETLTMKSFFQTGNDKVFVNITDTVGTEGPYSFPRAYERTMWPTTGLCVADTAPDDVSFSTLGADGGFAPPTPLTDAGMYCVATRPVPGDAGDAKVVQTRVATLPEVLTRTQVFTPTVERSPIVYQIILDLEIPVPDRCEEIIQKLEELLGKYMSSPGVPVHKLPTINLAQDATSRCAQNNDRTVEATKMAQAVKELAETLPGDHQQYHFMYFNNLVSPLPSPLVTSSQSLFDALIVTTPPREGYELRTHSWLFNPAPSGEQLPWWAIWVWQTIDDKMEFERALGEYKVLSLPYTTQLHDPFEPVLMMSADETAAHDGHLIKICNSSPQVIPIAQMPYQHPIPEPTWKISTADPPAYLVTLNEQRVVKASTFVEANAIVGYQICTRYCVDHPYVTANGSGAVSWAESRACAKVEL
jgi:hypothetical protein